MLYCYKPLAQVGATQCFVEFPFAKFLSVLRREFWMKCMRGMELYCGARWEIGGITLQDRELKNKRVGLKLMLNKSFAAVFMKQILKDKNSSADEVASLRMYPPC